MIEVLLGLCIVVFRGLFHLVVGLIDFLVPRWTEVDFYLVRCPDCGGLEPAGPVDGMDPAGPYDGVQRCRVFTVFWFLLFPKPIGAIRQWTPPKP